MTLKKAATLFMVAILALAVIVSSPGMATANQNALAVEEQGNIELLNAGAGISTAPILIACDGCSGGGNGGG